LEKTEAMRKLEGFSRQQSGIEQYRMGLEAYLRRQKDSMADIQTYVIVLSAFKIIKKKLKLPLGEL
jgi:hypothetical protein